MNKKEGKYEAGPDTPEQIVSLYEKQGGDSKKDGILIWCKLHSAPAIEKGKMMLTDHLQDRAKNTEYMKSLHEKVEALVEHCNKLGIPVWVNLQQHIKGDYKLLTQTIIKIEDRKSWTSSNGENIRGRVISFDPGFLKIKSLLKRLLVVTQNSRSHGDKKRTDPPRVNQSVYI